jgi:UDP-GlcNAc:undecaprenyl-phosphate/decaprenyl-phosphate GlcNAc-1-phosphate transferase
LDDGVIARSMLYPVIAALGIGLVLQPLVLRTLTARAIMDLPNERSSHTVPTPRGGGVAIAIAVAAGLALFPPARVFAVPLVLFAAIGLAEDVRGVPILQRFGFQLVAGVTTAALMLPEGMGLIAGGVAVVVAAVWLTGFVNAFNFMDGINGISATHAMLAGVVYAVYGVTHLMPLASVAAIVVAASATFLPWNAGRARMFLGDVGSYALGGLLAAVAVYGTLRGAPVEVMVAPLALYLADTGWALAKRFARGGEWYLAHREHVYQRLTDSGWSHQAVTLTTAAVSGLVCALAALGATQELVPRIALDLLCVVMLVGYLGLPGLVGAHRRSERNLAIANRRANA